VNNWSSEASSVILDDGTVRVFYRDGFSVLRYTDMIWSESQQNYVRDPQATEVSTTAAKKSGCQLTTILYSQPIDGKDAIIVATPANSGSRADGFLYVFLVDDDNSMELKYAYDITPNATEYYAYSCLTELNNGDLGLLWESAGAGITYSTIEMANVATRENDPTLTFKSVELLTGDSVSFIDNSGYYGDADLSELDTDVAELTLLGEETITDAEFQLLNLRYADGEPESLTRIDQLGDRQAAALMTAAELLLTGDSRAAEGRIPLSYDLGSYIASIERFSIVGSGDMGTLTNYRIRK
jgi:hypothetical protein